MGRRRAAPRVHQRGTSATSSTSTRSVTSSRTRSRASPASRSVPARPRRSRRAAAPEPLEDGFRLILAIPAWSSSASRSATGSRRRDPARGSSRSSAARAPWGLRNFIGVRAAVPRAGRTRTSTSLTDRTRTRARSKARTTPQDVTSPKPPRRESRLLAPRSRRSWAVAAWLLWRSSLPAYHLPHLDRARALPGARPAPRRGTTASLRGSSGSARRSRSSSCSASTRGTASAGCGSRRPARSARGCCSG